MVWLNGCERDSSEPNPAIGPARGSRQWSSAPSPASPVGIVRGATGPPPKHASDASASDYGPTTIAPPMKALGRRADGRQHDRQLAVVFLLLTLWLTGAGRMVPTGVAGTGPGPAASLNNITYSNSLVKTKYGPLRGIVFRTVPVVVEGFLGVPYASPPIGSLRYMPPVTPSTWKAPRLVDRFAPVCPQKLPKLDGTDAGVLGDLPIDRLKQLRRLVPTLVNQSEDCLYLNLYVPHAEDTAHRPDHLKPSIVYIHGESYEWNSGNHYDGSTLAMNGNVIVVTINFRLGVLGKYDAPPSFS
uniref:COesterase domain-containing protein n=1 Tax=Anopheles merus TaxID=30066 RepID=A0A182UPA4_ANOME